MLLKIIGYIGLIIVIGGYLLLIVCLGFLMGKTVKELNNNK